MLGCQALECPACSHELDRVEVGEVAVWSCRSGCGGAWVERFELEKLRALFQDEGLEFLTDPGAQLLQTDARPRRRCPRDGVLLMRHLFNPTCSVEVDSCPACAGLWLDGGKLAAVLAADDSDTELDAAVEQALQVRFGAQLAAQECAREALRGRFRRLRWLAPSTWFSFWSA